jgi:serine/threonine protein phosphatase PrpC
MNCPACGSDNREGARFCRSCGTELAQHPGSGPLDGALTGAVLDEVTAESMPATGERAAEPVAEAAEPREEGAADDGESGPGEPGAFPAEPSDGEAGEDLVAETSETTADETAEWVPEEQPGTEDRAEEPPAGNTATGEASSGGMVLDDDSPEDGMAAPEDAGHEPAEPEEAAALGDSGSAGPVEEDEELYGFWRNETEPLEPLPVSTVIAERYVVVKVVEQYDKEIRYLTHDLGRCWQCGFEGNDSNDEFCAQCGAMLDHWAEVVLVEVQAGRAMPSSGDPVLARLQHVGRHFLVLGEPRSGEAEVLTPSCMRLIVGQHSDKGQVRDLDEDSLLSLVLSPTYESRTGPVLGLFAVADGMGGYEGGEVASRLAIQTLADRVMRSVILPELAGEMILEDDVVVRLRQATIAANDDVYLTRQKGGNEMGTTLTVAFIRDDLLFLSHVGDCRAYRWNANGLEQLTTDHSVVASLIAEGRVQPEEIYTHPHRSVVYRCIGDKPLVEVDTDVLPLFPDDRLVLCCDGLWEMVRNEGIADVMMQESDPQLACELLVRRANAAGGEDNISVVIVKVESL